MNNIFQQRWPDNIDQTTATFPAIYLHGSATWSFFYVVIVVGKKIATYDKILAELEADNFSVSELFTNSGSDSDD